MIIKNRYTECEPEVDEVFFWDGKKIRCRKTETAYGRCKKCALDIPGCRRCSAIVEFPDNTAEVLCSDDERSDGNFVYFEEVKK